MATRSLTELPDRQLLLHERDWLTYERLVDAFTDRTVCAMVGAGISASAGYPTWGALLDALHDTAERQGRGKGREQNLPAELRTHPDVLWRAETYRSALGKDFGRVLTRLLRPRKPTRLARALVRVPFQHVLTTNFDALLEHAHRSERRGLGACRHVNWTFDARARRFLFDMLRPDCPRHYVYLHGRIAQPGSLILTDEDYTAQYLRNDSASRRLFALLTFRRMLFIGFSMTDPDLMTLLRHVNSAVGYRESRHFALIGMTPGADDVELVRDRFYRKYGVSVLLYDKRDGHQPLGPILERLREDAGRPEEAVTELAGARRERVVVDPEDPVKGRFGGRSEVNGRRLAARVRDLGDDWYEVALTVKATASARPLRGDVTFHLHPTFQPERHRVRVRRGVAELPIVCYGAFTVGATIQQERTRLELDLATLESAPRRFRMA